MDYRDSLFVIVKSCEGTPPTVPLITFAQTVFVTVIIIMIYQDQNNFLLFKYFKFNLTIFWDSIFPISMNLHLTQAKRNNTVDIKLLLFFPMMSLSS